MAEAVPSGISVRVNFAFYGVFMFCHLGSRSGWLQTCAGGQQGLAGRGKPLVRLSLTCYGWIGHAPF